jgi:hypothetical protein
MDFFFPSFSKEASLRQGYNHRMTVDEKLITDGSSDNGRVCDSDKSIKRTVFCPGYGGSLTLNFLITKRELVED